MAHPNTTPAEREAMLAQFNADLPPNAEFDGETHITNDAMRDMILEGTLAYLGDEYLELTEAGWARRMAAGPHNGE